MSILVHFEPKQSRFPSIQDHGLVKSMLEMLKQDLKLTDNRRLKSCELLLPKCYSGLVKKHIGQNYPWRSYSANSSGETAYQITQRIQQLKPHTLVRIGEANDVYDSTYPLRSVLISPGLTNPILYDSVQIFDSAVSGPDRSNYSKFGMTSFDTELPENILKIMCIPLHHKRAPEIYLRGNHSTLIVIDITESDKSLVDTIKAKVLSRTSKNKQYWVTLYPTSFTYGKYRRIKSDLKTFVDNNCNTHWIGNINSAFQYLVLLTKFNQVITNNKHCVADSNVFGKPVTTIYKTRPTPNMPRPFITPKSLAFSPLYFSEGIMKGLRDESTTIDLYHSFCTTTTNGGSNLFGVLQQPGSNENLQYLDTIERKARKLFRDPKKFFSDSKEPLFYLNKIPHFLSGLFLNLIKNIDRNCP